MNTKAKIAITSFFILAICFLVVKFVLEKESVKELPKITIGTFSKSMGNIPFYVAKEKGWFERALKNKYAIEYAEYNDRPSIASAISGGNLKFIFSAEVPAILIEAQGEDIEFENLSATLTQEIIVKSNSNLSTVKDLKGKNVAVLAGTSSHYALLKILNDNGLTPKDVKIIYMPPAEAKTAFENGKIDAWAVWAPWVEQQQVTGFAKSLSGSNAIICSVGSMPEKFIEYDKIGADSLSSIIKYAKKWILANPEEAQKIAAKQLQLDINVVKLAWNKFNWGATYDTIILNDIQKKADFLAREKLTRDNIIINVNKELIGNNLKE